MKSFKKRFRVIVDESISLLYVFRFGIMFVYLNNDPVVKARLSMKSFDSIIEEFKNDETIELYEL